MKRLLSVIVIVLLLITGCAKETEEVPETSRDILIAALDGETVPDSETIPSTDPTIPEETRATSGHCVDCGALITAPHTLNIGAAVVGLAAICAVAVFFVVLSKRANKRLAAEYALTGKKG